MDITSYLLGKNSSGGGGGGSDLDWSVIGFNGTPQAIKDGYNHAVEVMNNWDSTSTSFGTTFQSDRNLVIMPLIDISNVITMANAFDSNYALTAIALLNTENVTSMKECFSGCTGLTSVPKFNTKKVTTMQRMFYNCNNLASVPLFDTSGLTGNSFFYMFTNCYNLTDTSLDNILQMCINATGYTGTKSLSALGITSTAIYPATRIQALPHYQDFINAGWTIS